MTNPTVETGHMTSPTVETGHVTNPTVETGHMTNPTVETGHMTNPYNYNPNTGPLSVINDVMIMKRLNWTDLGFINVCFSALTVTP